MWRSKIGEEKKYKFGIISGYFNPIHAGHIDYINAAKSICDYLYVIVNNDKQAVNKTGKVFITEDDRLKIVNSIKGVDSAALSTDKDETVCGSIGLVLLDVVLQGGSYDQVAFINSGDRQSGNSKEVELCERSGVNLVYIPMEKIDSSTRIRSLFGE